MCACDSNPHSIKKLKTNIEDAIANIIHDTLHQVAHSIVKEIDAWIQNGDIRFQDIL